MIGKAAIGKIAPAFEAVAWHNGFKHVKLSDYTNQYLVLFFYPLDFTFVCPTEIVQFSTLYNKFKSEGCEVLGCSVDSQYTHMEYTKKPRKEGGLGEINFPLIADISKQISNDYGVTADGSISYRGTFLIDKEQKLRHFSVNDLPIGRNAEEYLRLLQAVKHNDKYGEVCPASWKPGADAMEGSHDSDKTKTYWEKVHTQK